MDLITDFTNAVIFDASRGEFIRDWEPLSLPPRVVNKPYHMSRADRNTEALRRIDAIRSARNTLLASVKRNNLDPVHPYHWYTVDLQRQLVQFVKANLHLYRPGSTHVSHFEKAFEIFRKDILDDLSFNGVSSGDAAFETEIDWVGKFTRDAPIILFIRGTSANLLLARFKQWEPIRLDQYVPSYG